LNFGWPILRRIGFRRYVLWYQATLMGVF
jgi:hypothetical protein